MHCKICFRVFGENFVDCLDVTKYKLSHKVISPFHLLLLVTRSVRGASQSSTARRNGRSHTGQASEVSIVEGAGGVTHSRMLSSQDRGVVS